MNRVDSLLGRPMFYYNIDGVGELGCGVMCLGWALLGWLQLNAAEGTLWHGMPAFIVYVTVMLSTIHFGSKAIKNRITYPRTGFVEYRKVDAVWRPMILGAAISALAATGVAMARRSRLDLTASAPLLLGLLFAGSYARGFARTAPWKWAVFAAMTLGSLLLAVLLPVRSSDPQGSPVFPAGFRMTCILTMALYGALLLISGGISFWLYLRRTQAPAQ
jgi:hypothetical protein